MQRIHNVLVDNDLSYVVIGGYALFFHNYERLTTDIDLLVSSDDFSQICSFFDFRRRDRQHRSSSKRSRSRDRLVKIFDTRTDRSISTTETKGENINIAWSQDGNMLSVGNKDDLITFIHTRTSKLGSNIDRI
ncbi:unnamed protein product [Didymodactylos carnosus]|uniref:Nucleotidyltransferase n=1 Tax=Didymodactylos carnosus TaxID=1234261 RepID=A0A8S2QI73_9BILA|nr:unnamed protein product [Didymodactylos carnosus]CAF4103962.1 unnamed protein product [Didymodactylos carnosus]